MRSHGYSPPPSTPPSNLLSARFRLDDLPQTILVVPPLRLAPSSSIERKRERERDRSEAIGSATKSEKKSTKKEQQEGSGEQVQFASRFNVANYGEQSQARSYSFQSSRVTYGGVNGTYYTSSTTRRSGNVGLSYLREGQANASSSPICIPSITSSLNTLTHANCNCKVTELKNIENLGETSAASTSENCYVSHLLPQGPGTDQLSLMEEARESLLVVEEESHSPNKSSECFKIGVKSIYQTMLYGLSVCYMSGAQRRPCSGFYTRWQKGCSIL